MEIETIDMVQESLIELQDKKMKTKNNQMMIIFTNRQKNIVNEETEVVTEVMNSLKIILEVKIEAEED